jgi:hypothetical protein
MMTLLVELGSVDVWSDHDTAWPYSAVARPEVILDPDA